MKTFMELFLPIFLIAGELFVTFDIFVCVRLLLYYSPDVQVFTMFTLGTGAICFGSLKFGLQFLALLTNISKNFSRIPYEKEKWTRFNKEDRIFLVSCRPLWFRVNDTFTVTEQTFLTVTNDIILSNVINLLVAFPNGRSRSLQF